MQQFLGQLPLSRRLNLGISTTGRDCFHKRGAKREDDRQDEREERGRRKRINRPCTPRNLLHPQMTNLSDRFRFSGESIQQFRQSLIAAGSGLKTAIQAIPGNNNRWNTCRPRRAKSVKTIFNHQALAGAEI